MKEKAVFLVFLFMSFLFIDFSVSVKCDGYDLEIVDFYPCDRLGNFRRYFEIGSEIYFNLTIRNLSFDPKKVSIRVCVFDELLDPLGGDFLDTTMPSDSYECYIVNSTIPRWAHVGPSAMVYVNILEPFATIPNVLEASADFAIITPSQEPENVPDVPTVIEAFGSYPGHPRWNPIADLNNDGKVNIIDLVIIGVNFGKRLPL